MVAPAIGALAMGGYGERDIMQYAAQMLESTADSLQRI